APSRPAHRRRTFMSIADCRSQIADWKKQLVGTLLFASCALQTGCGPSAAEDKRAPALGHEVPLVVCLGYADVEGGAAGLRPARGGRVVRVLVQEGEKVKENQELLHLDDGEARQELARAKAEVKAALAREALAKQEAAQHPSRLKQLRSTLEATSSRL